jgi:hypothetical protein
MGIIIIEKAIERRPGYLYYVDKEGNLCEAEMSKRGRPKKDKEVKE